MPTLGLAMIVKNGAKTLRDCISSVAEVTDQIVIADTGSSDGTPQLARDLGAEVFDLPWQDDFAQARNAAAGALTTDWVLVMDDDEELEPQARDKIPTLLDNARVSGYYFTQRNYLASGFGSGGHAHRVKPNDSTIPRAARAQAYIDLASCRLFRRHPEIYYVGRVHELVEPRIHALGQELEHAGLVIHHFGILCSAEERRAKDEYYRKLGWLKIKDAPNDPQAWIEVGQVEYEQLKNYSVGIECFQKALALSPERSPVPYLSLGNLYLEIHAYDRALELLSSVTMFGRAAGEKEHISGDALYNLGRLKEARSAYLRSLALLAEDTRVLSKLGLTEVRMGLKKNGLARLTRALRANPDEFQLHDRIIKAYLLLDLMPQAAEAAERLASGFPTPAAVLRAASIHAQMKQWEAAHEVIVRGLQLFPQNQKLLQFKTEVDQETNQLAQT
ncbi:MAG: glycosyltransferase [Candidatus Sulfotelmatobacter sp.]|jgi:glycosyltransferase involved in cell wall biosynthesis